MNPYTTNVTALKGIGDARAKQLLRLGVSTVWDLLVHFPTRFEDRTAVTDIFSAEDGQYACITARVVKPPAENRVRKNLVFYKAAVTDGSGVMTCTFFNNKYIKNMLKEGETYTFYGRVRVFGRKKEMTSPEFENSDKHSVTKCIAAIYPLSAGLTQNFIRNAVKEALYLCTPYFEETLPPEILKKYELCSVGFAIKNIHFPADFESLNTAKKRLVFEEFFILQAALGFSKKSFSKNTGVRFTKTDTFPIEALFPFTFTDAQKRTLNEIISDFSSGYAMNRLVQGDVGSGKTAVAAAALYICAANGYQAAMMAPTEVLARQHYRDLSPLLESLGIKCVLLTGSTPASEKRQIYAFLENGDASIAFGTHALITQNVSFKNLALAITDEQHRFGVRQRAALGEKGNHPHTMVMTATPIPRSLALIMYGDMDISVIDTLPPGRQKIDTFCVGENMRGRIYAFIKREIQSGSRVYYVCPSVEESGENNVKSVTGIYKEFSEKIFKDIPVGLIHGKMRPTQKEAAMRDFTDGKTSLLVATTVIEVGVNVPEATLIVIENAERFGLSQLHQLRGRVGRGKTKSYCVLFCSSNSEETKKRMGAMVKSNDGFFLSETDLKLRGPGDFFGTRQHGAIHLKIADLAEDFSVLKKSGEAAREMLSSDPLLLSPSHFYIRERIYKLLSELAL